MQAVSNSSTYLLSKYPLKMSFLPSEQTVSIKTQYVYLLFPPLINHFTPPPSPWVLSPDSVNNIKNLFYNVKGLKDTKIVIQTAEQWVKMGEEEKNVKLLILIE